MIRIASLSEAADINERVFVMGVQLLTGNLN